MAGNKMAGEQDGGKQDGVEQDGTWIRRRGRGISVRMGSVNEGEEQRIKKGWVSVEEESGSKVGNKDGKLTLSQRKVMRMTKVRQ